MVADRLAARHDIELKRVQSKAIIGSGRIAGRPVIIAKPQTFMNLSGESVRSLLDYYRIPAERLLVIYDELDLPFGVIRLREKGGAGGHNGMRSIIQHVGSDFSRLRLGIGRPPGRMDPAAYVLQDFGGDELPVVSQMLSAAVEAVESFIADGIDITMSRFNGPVEGQATA
jgi:PTH1 family peptidyl-tRNA hydrolase